VRDVGFKKLGLDLYMVLSLPTQSASLARQEGIAPALVDLPVRRRRATVAVA